MSVSVLLDRLFRLEKRKVTDYKKVNDYVQDKLEQFSLIRQIRRQAPRTSAEIEAIAWRLKHVGISNGLEE